MSENPLGNLGAVLAVGFALWLKRGAKPWPSQPESEFEHPAPKVTASHGRRSYEVSSGLKFRTVGQRTGLGKIASEE